jgi:hypothetical protein
MSTNLIYNGDFSIPVIATNTSLNYTVFTTGQANAFYWTCAGPYVQIFNGTPTSNFLNPSLIGYTQACYLLSNSSIQQSFTVPYAGSYVLSFYYSLRTGTTLSNMQIIINGVLFDTVTTIPTNWSRYMNTVPNMSIGVNTILLQGYGTSGTYAIVLTGIQFIYGQVGGAAPLQTASYNSFKTTNIYGGLTVYDYVSGGTTIPGSITTQQTYNYSYKTLPSFNQSCLGCIYTSTNAATSVAANSFTPSIAFVLPIGIYIANGYAIFTPTSAATHTLKLGISTNSGAFGTGGSAYNYTIDNCLVASALPHSISYNYFLTVPTATTYYFIFNTSIIRSMNISLNT